MRNILVPVDFSLTARNAAVYALQIAQQINAPKIILYNAYQAPLTSNQAASGLELLDEDQLEKYHHTELEKMRAFLKAGYQQNCAIDIYSECTLLDKNLDEVCKQTQSDFIVMGITGGGKVKEKLIGSNAISIAKNSKVQVIIVPSEAGFTRIHNVLLLSDFEEVDSTTPFDFLRKLLMSTNAKLHVVHVDEKGGNTGESFPPNMMGESYALHTILRNFYPKYHYIHHKKFVDAVNDFAKENQIDLIVIIPKKHNFFEKLFVDSHTTKLAFHSHIPILVVHK
jgi:nucleotide-binding universal stress UspA family protein